MRYDRKLSKIELKILINKLHELFGERKYN